MNTEHREIRSIDCKLSIRGTSPGGSNTSGSRIIRGTAIVFNSESVILGEGGQQFREVIKPEACTMDFLNSQDIKLNLLHDRQLTLARNNKNAKNATLHLSVDGYGVHFEFEAPKCDIGDRCLEMVKRGDYSGCSFEFIPQDYEIEEQGGDVKITHTKFRALFALTIGLDPAYLQTSVNARELAKERVRREFAKEEKRRREREIELASYYFKL